MSKFPKMYVGGHKKNTCVLQILINQLKSLSDQHLPSLDQSEEIVGIVLL